MKQLQTEFWEKNKELLIIEGVNSDNCFFKSDFRKRQKYKS